MQRRLYLLTGPILGLLFAGGQLAAETRFASDELTLIEGDILVRQVSDPDQSISAPANRGLALTNAFSRWPNGIALYELDPGLDDLSYAAVTSALAYWNNNSSISLMEKSDPDAPAGDDFITFVSGPGCASWVGRQGQEQEIWVSQYCTTGSMIHEIGHALGLLHEHTRADRDQHVQVLWDNIKQDKSFNFDINQAGTANLGEYDYDSIMHYGEYFFSSNGQPTLVPLNAPAGVVIGQRERLSAGDLANINTLYGTDLSLNYSENEQEDDSSLTFIVTNQGGNGAHKLELRFGRNDAITSFGSLDDWSCVNNTDELVCELGLLTSGSSSTLELNAEASVSVEQLRPALVAKTHDLDMTNNGYAESAFVGPVAAAIGEDGATGDSSGGGGALDLRLLLLLGLTVILKELLQLGGDRYRSRLQAVSA